MYEYPDMPDRPGVVSHHGEGVVIIADAEHGKTTLTLELVKRGFTFLSDALAWYVALNRHTVPGNA